VFRLFLIDKDRFSLSANSIIYSIIISFCVLIIITTHLQGCGAKQGMGNKYITSCGLTDNVEGKGCAHF